MILVISDIGDGSPVGSAEETVLKGIGGGDSGIPGNGIGRVSFQYGIEG